MNYNVFALNKMYFSLGDALDKNKEMLIYVNQLDVYIPMSNFDYIDDQIVVSTPHQKIVLICGDLPINKRFLKYLKTIKADINKLKNGKNIDAINKWITENPPLEDEGRGHYYEKYKLTNLDRITISKFNELMINKGYKLGKSSSGNRIWKFI